MKNREQFRELLRPLLHKWMFDSSAASENEILQLIDDQVVEKMIWDIPDIIELEEVKEELRKGWLHENS